MVCCGLIVRRHAVVRDELRGVAAFNCWLNLDLFEKKSELNSIQFWQSYCFMVCSAKIVRRDHAIPDEFREVAAINCWLNVDLFQKKVSSIPSSFGKVTVSWFAERKSFVVMLSFETSSGE